MHCTTVEYDEAEWSLVYADMRGLKRLQKAKYSTRFLVSTTVEHTKHYLL